MWNWKVEEQKLRTHHWDIGNRRYYSVEDVITDINEMFNILNEASDGELEYFKVLNEQYREALNKGEIKKGAYGCAKENSKKAWLKKHDTKHLLYKTDNWVNNYYYNKKFYKWGGGLYIGSRITDGDIKEMFHLYLRYLENLEWEYFREHDEYEIAKQQWKDLGCPCFGNHIWHGTDVTIQLDDEHPKTRRPLTLDEFKALIEAYNKVKAYEDEIAKTVKIEF